jgi:hypothetical protein
MNSNKLCLFENAKIFMANEYFLLIYMFLFNAFHVLTNNGIILTIIIVHHYCFNTKLISNDSKIELIENN